MSDLTIVIRDSDLGAASAEFGLTKDDLKLVDNKEARVEIYVDGVAVKPEVAEQDIRLTLKNVSNDELLTVVVTTLQGKLIRVLNYDPNANQDGVVDKPTPQKSGSAEPGFHGIISKSTHDIVKAINKLKPSESAQ
ncbi:hypothetical protein [Roseiarcus sp.]|uniref:hypothetical protein n=1 Tax=Roseiarcus sp. TaxID=1969460 RepID=UPI003F9720F6